MTAHLKIDSPPAAAIDRLLRPRSVVIVGASDKPGALGASVLLNLERNGFDGDIFLVNPKRDSINGRPCHAAIADLPEGIDAAVLAIPRAGVLDAVTQLAARKCGAAIVFSAGFAEGGEAGLAEQREMARIAGEAGMILEGPNCLGMVNHVDGVALTFVETHIDRLDGRPGIGIVSQSGAMACVLGVTLASRNLGQSCSVSTGNEAASGVEDYVEYLVDDPSTRVITMIVEQFRQPKRFVAAARRARAAGKTIVLLHPGRSQAARDSAATHTGAMAGDYSLMRLHVERAGVVFAETLEELADIAEIVIRCPALPSGGTVVLGESGAFKALTLDLCEDLGVTLPALSDQDSPALRQALPDFVAVSNPLDLTAQGLVEPDLYTRTLTALFGDDRFGVIVVGIIQTDPVTMAIKAPPILRAVTEGRPQKPVIFAGLDEGAPVPQDYIDQLRAAGVPYFPSTERAFRAIRRLLTLDERDFTVRPAASVATDLSGLSDVVPEYLCKAALRPLGLPFPDGRFVTTIDAALVAADALGFPLVLKAQAAALSHKSDAGGVILNIADADGLRAAWTQLHANIARHAPDLTLDGVLVERMGRRGTECIVGAKVDPDWGPAVLVGLGGVTAELFHDVRLLTADMPVAAIVAELHRLKSAAILRGYRGSPELDVEALARVVAAVGDLLVAQPRIRELDLNPVVVYPKGDGVTVLDALMLLVE